MTEKVEFNIKALLRLACNMVTQADPESNVQDKCLSIVSNSEQVMNLISSSCEDDHIVFPFLVFLYNAMATKDELRASFVNMDENFRFGLKTLIAIFCHTQSEAQAEHSDSDSDSQSQKVNEWLTRLMILLLANQNMNLNENDEIDVNDDTRQSLFNTFVEQVPEDHVSNLFLFYVEVLKLNLEQAKSKVEQEATDQKTIVCQDILPRHLIRDTVKYGQRRLQLFKQAYSSDEILTKAYGYG